MVSFLSLRQIYNQKGMLLWSLVIGTFGVATRERDLQLFTTRAETFAKRLGYIGYNQLDRPIGKFCHSDTLRHAALRRLVE